MTRLVTLTSINYSGCCYQKPVSKTQVQGTKLESINFGAIIFYYKFSAIGDRMQSKHSSIVYKHFVTFGWEGGGGGLWPGG